MNEFGFATMIYRFLIPSTVLTLLICPFVWYAFTVTTKPFQDFLLALSLTIIPNILSGACYFWYIDALLLDPRTRVRIFGVAYNIGALLFAGTAPFLGATFIKLHGQTMGSILIGSWVSLVALLNLIAPVTEILISVAPNKERFLIFKKSLKNSEFEYVM